MNRVLVSILAALFLCYPAAAGQEGADVVRPNDAELERRRERWEALSEEERAVLRERFEALRAMDPEERLELRRRIEHLDGLRERARRDVSAERRARLEREPRPVREAFWRERMLERARREGGEVRRHLPPELVRRLEQAAPEERPRILRAFRAEQRERKSGYALRHLGRELGVTDEELERWNEAPVEERMHHLRRLRRRAVERRLPDGRGPSGLGPEEWESMRRLGDREFFRRARGLDLPAPYRHREGRGPRGGARRRPPRR